MATMTEDSPPPRLAAAVILIRDGSEGLEVLMTERPAGMGFADGALVFPGGKADAEDHCRGPEAAAGLAAIRELFEECAVLLARRTASAAMATPSDLAALTALPPGGGFHTRLAMAGLEAAPDLLVPFAHWITPRDRPKRFDTRFFLARMPQGQTAAHDRHEVAAMRWGRPADILAEATAKPLVIATHMNLAKLCRWRGAAAALEDAGRRPVVTVQPERVDTPQGLVIRLPAAADYGVTEVPASLFRRS